MSLVGRSLSPALQANDKNGAPMETVSVELVVVALSFEQLLHSRKDDRVLTGRMLACSSDNIETGRSVWSYKHKLSATQQNL